MARKSTKAPAEQTAKEKEQISQTEQTGQEKDDTQEQTGQEQDGTQEQTGQKQDGTQEQTGQEQDGTQEQTGQEQDGTQEQTGQEQDGTQEQERDEFADIPNPCVYCGPSVRGVARQYTTYQGGIPAELKEFVKAHPAARGLIVSTEKFASVRRRLETHGTAEAIIYKKVKDEL